TAVAHATGQSQPDPGSVPADRRSQWWWLVADAAPTDEERRLPVGVAIAAGDTPPRPRGGTITLSVALTAVDIQQDGARPRCVSSVPIAPAVSPVTRRALPVTAPGRAGGGWTPAGQGCRVAGPGPASGPKRGSSGCAPDPAARGRRSEVPER